MSIPRKQGRRRTRREIGDEIRKYTLTKESFSPGYTPVVVVEKALLERWAAELLS